MSFEEACQNFLEDMIGPAKNKGIIIEDRLTDVTRKYRNLIHPGREIKESLVFEEKDAVLAKTAVDIVMRDVRSWAAAERKQRKLRKFLSGLDKDERDFLQLFTNPQVKNIEHPLVRHNVYRSSERLVENGVLIKEVNGELGNNREKFTLVREAVMLVEELVLKGKVHCNAITLDTNPYCGFRCTRQWRTSHHASVCGSSSVPRVSEGPSVSVFPAVFEVSKNQAVVEESTQVVVALNDIFLSRKALLTITLPGKEPQRFPDTVAGHVWRFERQGNKYRMTLLEVNYVKDRAKLEVRPDPDF